MTSRILKTLAILAVTSLVAGCKLDIVATQGGDVKSKSGSKSCQSGNICEFEIAEAPFSEMFTAIPKEGYQFVKWHKGAGFLCGDSTNPNCSLTIPADQLGAVVIGHFKTPGYLMPEYEFVGLDTDGDGTRDPLDTDDDNDGVSDLNDPCPLDSSPDCVRPITDTVMLWGKEWAQVDLFTNLSWNDINAVCPEGVCNGVLNGYDMTGWTWASEAQLRPIRESISARHTCSITFLYPCLIGGYNYVETFGYNFDSSTGISDLAIYRIDNFLRFRPTYNNTPNFDMIAFVDGVIYLTDYTDILNPDNPPPGHVPGFFSMGYRFDQFGQFAFARSAPNDFRSFDRGAWFYRIP